MQWAHAGPVVLASFLASLVEFVEALTIVLAVGTVRGWRSALLGAAAGASLLGVVVIAFGPALQHFPLSALQLVIGVLLVLFGMRWLRKAVLRAAGIIGLHDEEAIFAREARALRTESEGRPTSRLDKIGFATAFKAVVLEGLEVVFIVIATGTAGNMLVPASLGAAAAGTLVLLAGVALHRPLSRIPENALKFSVGVILSAFGVFWIGEGIGLHWPREDLALVALGAGFLAAATIGVLMSRRALASNAPRSSAP
jgi:Ca2+/H+ antiporter, TMEM165/GDT1 family